jgi:predicted lipid-binding transport protein (Tim44 family)
MTMRVRRCLGLVLGLALALAPALADAKAGGGSRGMGSRGSRTFQSAPATPSSPSMAPVERSITPQPGPQVQPARPGGSQQPPVQPLGPGARPSFAQRNPFVSGLMGGFLGAGIAGLLFGGGLFGSGMGGAGLGGAGMLGLLLQLALLGGLAWLVIRFMRQRGILGRPAAAPAAYTSAPTPLSPQDFGYPPADVGNQPRSSTGAAAPGAFAPAGGDEIGIGRSDYESFERLLSEIQKAWSAGDLQALRPLLTPEMLSYFSQALSANLSRGIANRVEQVKLLQGDLAEAWREGDIDYATVAMRWQAIDQTVDIASGKVVEGDPVRPSETAEVWTFMRLRDGKWLLSAIQPEVEQAVAGRY